MPPDPTPLTDECNEYSDDDNRCGAPCDPARACDECAEYWQRMRHDGFWEDGSGWTDKGMKEMTK